MKIAFLFVFSGAFALSQGASSMALDTDSQTNYAALLAGVVAACSAITSYNAAAVAPSYTCANEPIPEKIDPKVEVAGKEKASPSDTKTETTFVSDENPNKTRVMQQACTTETNIDILEKCIPSFSDKLKRGQITYEQIQKMPHEGFHIRGHDKRIEHARSWEFHHENRARQDIGVTVTDGYYFGKGKAASSELMFFPRKQVQQYSQKDGILEVTLSNGESMKFNSKTGVLESGVLKESKPIRGKAPTFTYEGTGVMIQMAGMEGNGLSYRETATNAVITKRGHKPCVVPASELWPQRKTDGANNFRFATDEGLDQWLKKSKCGFSL